MRLPGATSVSRCCSDCGAAPTARTRAPSTSSRPRAPRRGGTSASKCGSDCPREGAKYEFPFESTSL
eukprot:4396105-Heterocapsa_arctica.AAC.1